MIDQSDDRNPVEVLGEEFLLRRRRGEQTSMREYAEAHPALADEIRVHFPTMLALEQFKSSSLSSSGDSPSVEILPLPQLDDFQIIRELGRGGMGVVYEARQKSLDRRVAIKVVTPNALRDPQQLSRFHREARTSARLHHTNIVPVFGVGQQGDVQYFVMQRIDGVSLDILVQRSIPGDKAQACVAALASNRAQTSEADSESGSSESLDKTTGSDHRVAEFVDPYGERSEWKWVAEIGIQVAQALVYAHAQEVLHRDIKPGNLLLDPDGTVWVTDFGLATVMHSDEIADRGKVVGTLRYMAPEQTSGAQDRRSDIYGLGATLYEILTRQPAFSGKNRANLFDKVMKGQFAKPSVVRPSIPLDLEAIVLKAMAHQPGRRYQTAQAFAEDLERFVEGRPVLARPIGSATRVVRWTKRSPVIASLSTALLLVALCSFVIIGAKWREAVAENRRAEQNLSLALESMNHILGRLTSSWTAEPDSISGLVEDEADPGIGFRLVVSDHNAVVLKDALRFYDRFSRQNPTDPLLQTETAKVHRRVADIYMRLGQYASAEEAYRRSIEILDSQPNSQEMPIVLERARARNEIGLVFNAKSEFKKAELNFQQAQRILAAPARTRQADCLAEVARTLTNLGQVQSRMLRHDEARASHQSAFEILKTVVKEYSDNVGYRLALARAYRAYHPFVSSRSGEREQIREAGISIFQSLVDDFPELPDYRCELGEMLIITSHRHRGSRDREAEMIRLERGVSIARELSENYPSIPRYQALLARALRETGRAIRSTRPEEAEDIFLESLTQYHALAATFQDTPAYRIMLAMALEDRADMLRRSKQDHDIRPVLEEAISQQSAYVRMRPENQFGKKFLAHLYRDLASTLSSVGELEAAEDALNQAEEIRRESGGSSSRRR